MRPAGFAETESAGSDRAAFLADCLAGLSATPKALPCKWFYDAAGSILFEQITTLPEYYPTRAETALLHAAAPEIATSIGPGTVLVEFGSGASVKTRILLDAAAAITRYVPIDISGDELGRATELLKSDFPELSVTPVHADFTATVALDADARARPRLGFFPGSTIGNFEPDAAIALLASMRASLGPGARLLLGVDLKKDSKTLIRAYDDAQGVTAAFNLNLLARMKRELGATIHLARFRHRALWNEAQSRVEMHLESLDRQDILLGGHSFVLNAGETIHTENCHKYSLAQLEAMTAAAGWTIVKSWISAAPEFALVLLDHA